MPDVCYGRSERGRYNASSCQWNRFLADFSADGETRILAAAQDGGRAVGAGQGFVW